MRNDEPLQSLALRAAALVFCAATLVGCASAPGASRTEQAAVPASVPQEIVRPAKPARIDKSEALELTVTESIRIGSDVRAEYELALQQIQAGSLQEGIQTLHSVIEQAPELTAPHINLGMAHARLEQYDQAEASLQHALVLTPEHPVALNELGIVYRKTGRFADARRSYQAALEVMASYHYAQRNLAVLCDMFLQDLECAIANYRAYQQAFPEDRQVQVWIADLERRLTPPATPSDTGE